MCYFEQIFSLNFMKISGIYHYRPRCYRTELYRRAHCLCYPYVTLQNRLRILGTTFKLEHFTELVNIFTLHNLRTRSLCSNKYYFGIYQNENKKFT
jgi:hypothetical protein